MTKTYKRLARHAGFWRVDGIGHIEARWKLGARATVYFSGIAESGLSSPYKRASLDGRTWSLRVHSASLRDFRVGTIWENGKCVFRPPKEDTALRIDTSQVRLVTLDAQFEINKNIVNGAIPDSHFPLGGNNRWLLSKSLYAIVPVTGRGGIKWLIIPTSELLRFYTGISSRLLSGALQGRLDDFVRWDLCRMEDSYAVLHVKQRVSRKEAFVLGQAVASNAAKSALLLAHQHLSSVLANNSSLDAAHKQPLVIKATFPFSNATTLRVSGKRMPLVSDGDNQQWAIFAMEIRSCSHHPEFTGILLEGEEPLDGNVSGNGVGIHPPKYNPLLKNDDDDDDDELEDPPADKRLPRLPVLNYTNQFSAFSSIDFKYRKTGLGKQSNHSGTAIDILVKSLTNENGSHSNEAKGNLGISEFQSHVDHVDRDISLFLEMLQHLRAATKNRDWTITTLPTAYCLSKNGESISQFPEMRGKRLSWHKIIGPDGKTHPRQVVWVEVAMNKEGRLFYLLEMELKSGNKGQCTILLFKNDHSKLGEDAFNKLLKLTAINNRWPNPSTKWKKQRHEAQAAALFSTFKMRRIIHPRSQPIKNRKSGLMDQKQPSAKAWSEALLKSIDELQER